MAQAEEVPTTGVGSRPSGYGPVGSQWHQLQTKCLNLLCSAVQVNTEAKATPPALCTAERFVSSVTLYKFPLPQRYVSLKDVFSSPSLGVASCREGGKGLAVDCRKIPCCFTQEAQV